MKGKITFFGLLIFSTLFSSGQKLQERVFSDEEYELSRFKSSDLVGDSVILISGQRTLSDCPRNFLGAFSTSGNTNWTIKDEYSNEDCGGPYCSGFFSRIKHLGDYIYGCGEAIFGDIANEVIHMSIFKWDLDGNKIFHKWHHNEEWDDNFLFVPVHMDVTAADGILITGGEWIRPDRLVRLDLDGDFVWEKEYPFTITRAVFTNNGNLALISEKTLYLTSAEGGIIRQVDFETNITDLHYMNNQVMVSEAESLHTITLDNDLSMDSRTLEPGTMISKIVTFNDQWWVLQQKGDTTIVSNYSDQEQKSFRFHTPSVTIQNFHITKNEIVLTGETTGGQMAMIAFGKTESIPAVSFPDIELVDFEISKISTHYEDIPNVGKIPQWAEFDSHLTIRNNGNEIIDFAWLQSDRCCNPFGCGGHFYYRLLDKLDLHPQQEITLEIGRSRDYQNFQDFKICFQLMAPNSRLEANVSNNLLCKTFDLTSIINPSALSAWNIYPNPANHYLIVEAPDNTPIRYQVISIEGKVIISGTKDEGSTTLDVSDLPAGIYFIRLFQANESKTLKFFRQ